LPLVENNDAVVDVHAAYRAGMVVHFKRLQVAGMPSMLQRHRPDLTVIQVDTQPTGMAVLSCAACVIVGTSVQPAPKAIGAAVWPTRTQGGCTPCSRTACATEMFCSREEILELIELEVRELLSEYEFPGDDLPVVRVSALKALEGDKESGEKLLGLMHAVDEAIPIPERDVDKPFLMPIEDVFTITGRGAFVTDRIARGVLKVNETVDIIGIKTEKTSMLGHNTAMTVALIQPVAMEEGLKFAIREGGRTVGAGQVTKILK
jgi:hypothetical protein